MVRIREAAAGHRGASQERERETHTGPAVLLVSHRGLCRDLLGEHLASVFGCSVAAESPDRERSVIEAWLLKVEAVVCCLADTGAAERIGQLCRNCGSRARLIGLICPWGPSLATTPMEGWVLLRCRDGLPPLDQAVAHAFRRAGSWRNDARAPSLTQRQREVAALVVRGWTNERIARKLRLSPRTVEGHRLNAMRRLGVGTTAELVSECLRRGLLEDAPPSGPLAHRRRPDR